MNAVAIDRLLAAAVAEQRNGRTDRARRHLYDVLKTSPEHPKALNSLGVLALDSHSLEEASAFFARAIAADPGEPALRLNLAKARRLAGDDEGERKSLQAALACDRRNFMALVRMAELHERLGEDAQAAGPWSGVVAMAATIPDNAALAALVARGKAFVQRHNAAFAQIIDKDLAPLRDGLEAGTRRRFDAAIDHLLGRRTIYQNVCEGLFFPFLPADEFFDAAHFPWLPELEARTEDIRDELEAVLRQGGEGLVPYVSQPSGTPANKWSGLNKSADWSAYHLYEFGARKDAACAACPRTAAALDALPLADLPGRAPTAFFSILRPRTRIPPHTGVSNTRAIVHLPLIVPPGCGFRVGGETREWRVGEAFGFDDTIEHEAWNDSDEPRAVLILDVWNPHLIEPERALLREFYRVADASGHNPELAHDH